MPHSTFLLADLVGYTALTEAMGDEQAADIATEFMHAARRYISPLVSHESSATGIGLWESGSASIPAARWSVPVTGSAVR